MAMKKAFVFSLLSLFLVALATIVFTLSPIKEVYTDPKTATVSVNVMSDFTRDLKEGYLKVIINTASRASLNTMSQYIDTEGPYENDVPAIFKELMMTGNLSGTDYPEMDGLSIPELAQKIADLGTNELGIVTNITVRDVSINQSNPYYLNVTVEFFFMTNQSGTVFRYDALEISENVSIEYLFDPAWKMYSPDHCLRTIKFYKPTTDLTPCMFMTWVKDRTYMHFETSPSFLDRLRGDPRGLKLNSTCCGIQTLITDYFYYLQDSGKEDCSIGGNTWISVYQTAFLDGSTLDNKIFVGDTLCEAAQPHPQIFDPINCLSGFNNPGTVKLTQPLTTLFNLEAPIDYSFDGCGVP